MLPAEWVFGGVWCTEYWARHTAILTTTSGTTSHLYRHHIYNLLYIWHIGIDYSSPFEEKIFTPRHLQKRVQLILKDWRFNTASLPRIGRWAELHEHCASKCVSNQRNWGLPLARLTLHNISDANTTQGYGQCLYACHLTSLGIRSNTTVHEN